MITVKFNEAVDFSSIFDVVNWEVNIVISDNSGWGMYLYCVNSGIAWGYLVSGNGSGVYIWDNGGVNFERNRVVNNRGVGLETPLFHPQNY